MRLFNAHMVESIMDRLNLPEDIPIESKMVSRSIRSAQTQIEQQNFEIRKNVLKYDEVLNKQRTVIYDERRRVLSGEDLHEQVRNMIDDAVTGYIEGAASEGFAEDWDLDTLWGNLKQLYPVSLSIEEIEAKSGGVVTADFLIDELCADAQAAYDHREASLGTVPGSDEPLMRDLERRVMLEVLDRKWREHLYEMDYLQEGISLRGYGQRDPLVEYQREAFDMFTAMMEGIKEESVGFLFFVQVNIEQFAEETAAAEAEGLAAPMIGGAPQPFGAPATEPGEHPEPESALAQTPLAQTARQEQQPLSGSPAPFSSAQPTEDHRAVADVLGQALGGAHTHRDDSSLQYSAPSEDGSAQASRPPAGAAGGTSGGQGASFANASRNAPCPCGSGRKYKRCHGAPENQA
jgi:preprotein translocase subunit SecA